MEQFDDDPEHSGLVIDDKNQYSILNGFVFPIFM
jgi:hypothetical protein